MATTSPTSRWLLDIEQAARELHQSRAGLYKLIARGPQNGGIASIKVGRRRLIPVQAVEAYIGQRLEEATA